MTKSLHEALMDRDNPMSNSQLPVKPKQAEVPIIVVNRWMRADDVLVKTYEFQRPDDRQSFMMQLFEYEKEIQHNAEFVVTMESITVKVSTHNVGVTELDMEYARFADALFKDVVYNPCHAREATDSPGY